MCEIFSRNTVFKIKPKKSIVQQAASGNLYHCQLCISTVCLATFVTLNINMIFFQISLKYLLKNTQNRTESPTVVSGSQRKLCLASTPMKARISDIEHAKHDNIKIIKLIAIFVYDFHQQSHRNQFRNNIFTQDLMSLTNGSDHT